MSDTDNEEIDNILDEAIDDFDKILNEEKMYHLISFNNKPCFFHKDYDKCYKYIHNMIEEIMDNLDFIIYNYSFPSHTFIINEIYNI